MQYVSEDNVSKTDASVMRRQLYSPTKKAISPLFSSDMAFLGYAVFGVLTLNLLNR